MTWGDVIMVIVILKCVCVCGKPGGGQGESQGSERKRTAEFTEKLAAMAPVMKADDKKTSLRGDRNRACEEDRQTHCGTIEQTKLSSVHNCLQSNLANLSPQCRKKTEKRIAIHQSCLKELKDQSCLKDLKTPPVSCLIAQRSKSKISYSTSCSLQLDQLLRKSLKRTIDPVKRTPRERLQRPAAAAAAGQKASRQ